MAKKKDIDLTESIVMPQKVVLIKLADTEK